MISEKVKEYYDLNKRNDVRESAKRLRRQFLRYRDAEIVYSIQHKKLLELAGKAGAIYRMDNTVLINRDIFDAYLEQFHEPSTLATQEEEACAETCGCFRICWTMKILRCSGGTSSPIIRERIITALV